MMRALLQIALAILLSLCSLPLCITDALARPLFDKGTPVLQDIWVDGTSGDDANSGLSGSEPLRTVGEALRRIPGGVPLAATGYRIMVAPGDYPESSLPAGGWIESLQGTFAFPVIIQAAEGPHSVRFHGYLTIYGASHLYLIDLDLVTDPGYGGGGNVIHIASSDTILIRGCTLSGFDGSTRQPQETLKVNQSRHVYVENSDISGAFWFPLDFVATQYGHIVGSRIHNSGDDCLLLKGGTAYFTVEGNEIYDCGTTGFTAGQGTGFEYMVSPWIHYEVYDIRLINNILHDVVNAGMAVRGGYNVLLAHNTLYRIGYDPRGSALLLISHGARSCDGDGPACQARSAEGGWGPLSVGDEVEGIPNRNVAVYNNIFYNPQQLQTLTAHFSIAGPAVPPALMNIPAPSDADANLSIRGNIIWNGPADHPLGIEESDQGCRPSNPVCNEAQLREDNWINRVLPELMNPARTNYHPLTGSTIYQVPTFTIPDFSWADAPANPLPPQGLLSNSVFDDRDGNRRRSSGPPGAYALPLCPDASTFSGDLILHVPSVRLSDSFFAADFRLLAGTLSFELITIQGLSGPSAPECSTAAVSADLSIHIPALTLGGNSYWLDLIYAKGLQFTLTAAGMN